MNTLRKNIDCQRICRKKEKPYLFQIVANKTNGLDVDK